MFNLEGHHFPYFKAIYCHFMANFGPKLPYLAISGSSCLKWVEHWLNTVEHCISHPGGSVGTYEPPVLADVICEQPLTSWQILNNFALLSPVRQTLQVSFLEASQQWLERQRRFSTGLDLHKSHSSWPWCTKTCQKEEMQPVSTNFATNAYFHINLFQFQVPVNTPQSIRVSRET